MSRATPAEHPRYTPGTPEHELWQNRIAEADENGFDHVFLQPSSSLAICRICASLVGYGGWAAHTSWHGRLIYALAKADITVEDI